MAYLILLAGGWGMDAAPRTAAIQRPASIERRARTPAQRKIDSQLLHEIYRLRGDALEKNVPPGRTGVKIDAKQRALVDVRADVTQKLQTTIKNLGGTLVSISQEHRTIVAWIPLLEIEHLAAEPAVRAIGPQIEAETLR